MNPRQPVVTGLGVVAPGGIGVKAFWELLSAGRSATRRITLFSAEGFGSQVAAEVDFFPEEEGLSASEVAGTDRAGQFALVCAREAVADGGLDPARLPVERMGVSVGSAVGSTMTLEQEYVVVSDVGQRWVVDPAKAASHLYQALVPSGFAADIARAFGVAGPVCVISTGCTSGLDAVAHAADLIQDGGADIMLAGATDAPISPISAACFDAIRATSRHNHDPEHASRPFHRDRDGFVLGEGAAMLLLETAESAARRGATVYCTVAGSAQRSNAYHMTGLRPDGAELAEAIRAALSMARLVPADVDYINAHGSGTRQNDRHETAAFKRALGRRAYEVPVSSIKSMIGHSLGAIGAIELAASALAIQSDLVPPTANLDATDPDLDLDYVPMVARAHRSDVVLSVGSGFGGFQTAVVLARPEAEVIA